MNIEKAKKGHPKRNKFVFLALWLIGHGLAWAVFYAFDFLSNALFFRDYITYAAAALFVGGITSLTQYALIRWQFGRNIKWWIPLSMIAWFFAALVPFPASFRLGNEQLAVSIQALALYAPAALVQVFLLRQHIKQAWLWLLATIAGTSVFALTIVSWNFEEWAISLGYGLYASATALTLLWLFGMSIEANKAENQLMAKTTIVL